MMEDTNKNVIFLACGNLQSTSEDRYLYNERMTSVLEVSVTSLRKEARLCEAMPL